MTSVSLKGVTKGKVEAPYKIVLYGKMGVGKSSFGAQAPSPIFMDVEDSTTELDVARFPRPRSYEDMLAGIHALTNEQHDYKTFVLDTVDAAETLVWDHCIAQARKDPKYANITDLEQIGGGYGKGAVAALMAWRVFFGALDALVEKKGMHVIILGHSAVKKFNSPEVAIEPFDRYVLKLLPSTSAFVSEWPKAMMFADYEMLSTERDKRVFGVSTGKRVLHATHSAAWDAKNRYGLPDSLPLDWRAFDDAAKASAAKTSTAVLSEIKRLSLRVAPDVAAKVPAAIERAGSDLSKLTQLVAWLNNQPITKEAA